MNKRKQEQKLASISTLTEKIYNVVPKSEPWPVKAITSEFFRQRTTSCPAAAIQRGLHELREAGLVKESPPGHYRAVDVADYVDKPAPKLKSVTSSKGESNTVSITHKKESAKEVQPKQDMESLFDCVESVIAALDQALAKARRAQEIALELQGDNEQNTAELEKLKTLKSLLKDL